MNLFETLLQDLRYGARTLRRNPSFTIVSILALALGIGVNVAVFTAYKAFIARPLDARDPDTLVNLSLRLQSGATDARFSYPDYEAYRDGLRSFSGVIAFSIERTDAHRRRRRRREAERRERIADWQTWTVAVGDATGRSPPPSSFLRITSRCWASRPSVAARSMR